MSEKPKNQEANKNQSLEISEELRIMIARVTEGEGGEVILEILDDNYFQDESETNEVVRGGKRRSIEESRQLNLAKHTLQNTCKMEGIGNSVEYEIAKRYLELLFEFKSVGASDSHVYPRVWERYYQLVEVCKNKYAAVDKDGFFEKCESTLISQIHLTMTHLAGASHSLNYLLQSEEFLIKIGLIDSLGYKEMFKELIKKAIEDEFSELVCIDNVNSEKKLKRIVTEAKERGVILDKNKLKTEIEKVMTEIDEIILNASSSEGGDDFEEKLEPVERKFWLLGVLIKRANHFEDLKVKYNEKERVVKNLKKTFENKILESKQNDFKNKWNVKYKKTDDCLKKIDEDVSISDFKEAISDLSRFLSKSEELDLYDEYSQILSSFIKDQLFVVIRELLEADKLNAERSSRAKSLLEIGNQYLLTEVLNG